MIERILLGMQAVFNLAIMYSLHKHNQTFISQQRILTLHTERLSTVEDVAVKAWERTRFSAGGI